MTDQTIGNLGDIPDLSGIEDTQSEPFLDGWYAGTIVEKREFTDRNGNDRLFLSADEPSQNGDSRNIKLQLELKRATDGKTLNISTLVNYRPEDLSAETVAAVVAQQGNKNSESMGELFRPFMTLKRLSSLQKIAGVRSLGRNGNGGLDLHCLFGKQGYFRIKPDRRNAAYKEVVEFRDTRPSKVL